MKNQECKVRPEITIKTSKCSGSCNDINDPYVKLCFPDVVKILIIKVFHLISRNNETRYVKWHETCKSKCTLDASICNSKQSRHKDKCRCECKELIYI